jgi:drug/metabolite transporter (DMT)-like permease
LVLESILFGVLAALGWGVSDFAAAMIAKRVGVLWTVLGVHAASVGVAALYFVLVVGFVPISPTQWAALVGLAGIGLTTYFGIYKALQVGPVAIVSPIISAYAVVVILLAVIFAGERLGGLQIIAVSASIGGVVLASLNLNKLSSLNSIVSRGALLALMGMLAIGVWQFSLGIITREMGWFLPLFVSRGIALAFLLPVTAVASSGQWKQFTIRLVIAVSLAGMVELGALFAFARGTEIGVISIVAAASTIYPALPMIGGLVIFRERISPTQYVGLFVALLGLTMLALST